MIRQKLPPGRRILNTHVHVYGHIFWLMHVVNKTLRRSPLVSSLGKTHQINQPKMNTTTNLNHPAVAKRGVRHFSQMAVRAIFVTAVLLCASKNSSAQTTNAYDVAADPANAGAGAPNGLSPGGQNGGFGFAPWTFTVQNTGGAFINGSGPSGDSFDLWNVSASSSTIAVRPFSSPLV
ncbi:MAG TPA: hypothetical protein VN048_04110, partial [Verrucomicrobiae bacterium]|nr:hypothetical protein [Verrucomicrobiae bacterium]